MFVCLQNDVSETNGGSGKTSQLQKIAHQSEGSEFEYFQQNLLQPFLVTRVPDTDGNRKVQQACARVISNTHSHTHTLTHTHTHTHTHTCSQLLFTPVADLFYVVTVDGTRSTGGFVMKTIGFSPSFCLHSNSHFAGSWY